MLLTEFDEEAFVSAMREEGRREGIQEGRKEGIREGRREGLISLVVMMREYVSSPQELYQKIISNKSYKDFTFEEVQRIAESVEKSNAE